MPVLAPLRALIVFANAICILNEERFLMNCFFALTPVNLNYTPNRPREMTVEGLAFLVHSIQSALRLPLIFLNVITIVLNLIWG
jgi:hypothetical protein